MKRTFESALPVLYLVYNLAILYFTGQALVEISGVDSTFGAILLFIGAGVAFFLIPLSPILASLLVLYYLVEYEYWNIFFAFLFVFPGFAITLLSIFGIATQEIIEKLKNKWEIYKIKNAQTRMDNTVTDVAPIDNQTFLSKHLNEYINILKDFANIKGKQSRGSFWRFTLMHFLFFGIVFNFVCAFALNSVPRYSDTKMFIWVIWLAGGILASIPQLTAAVRRMNDAGGEPAVVYLSYGLSFACQFFQNEALAIITTLLNICVLIKLCTRSEVNEE